MIENSNSMFEFAHIEVAVYLEEILKSLTGTARLRVQGMRNTQVSLKWGVAAPAVITSHMLVLVKSGQGVYQVNGEDLSLKRGRLVFISAGCTLAYHPDPDHRPVLLGVHFSSESPAQANGSEAMTKSPCYTTLTPRHLEPIAGLFEQLFHAWRKCPDPLAQLTTENLLQALLWSLREECLHRNPDAWDQQMEDLRLRMESDPTSGGSISELAKQLHMSASQLSRRFRRHTGVPPQTYLIQSSMRHAWKLLHEHHLSVGETAEKLGYSDAFAFSHRFKRVWGISPSQVRRGMFE
jgi:AraC-like DNA-binding protein